MRNAKGDKSGRYIVTKVRYIVPGFPIPVEYPKFRNIHVVPRYPVPMEVHGRVNSAQRLETRSHSVQCTVPQYTGPNISSYGGWLFMCTCSQIWFMRFMRPSVNSTRGDCVMHSPIASEQK